ncbi:PKD domain-containing protein [Pseudoalteromonas viridis]|uniref:PKD domain-containing protein n=1 Tax=Pseudoalteromonas viridis TaxID=339617 RepID=A0ABX7V6W3_9GAMM|nr:PKD domain-containing protein [Pseudoalteromonas viridis]QTL35507.1 PKD domain-containing protein [Pseudoalteromonas viridis]
MNMKRTLTAVMFGVLANATHATELTYHWQFGDGQTSNQVQPEYQYSTPGFYTVTLEVFDGQTLSYSKQHEVDAVTPLIKQFDIQVAQTVTQNQPTALIASLSTTAPLELDYQWHLPDGSKQAGDQISLSFTQTGAQEVTLVGLFSGRQVAQKNVVLNVQAASEQTDNRTTPDSDGNGTTSGSDDKTASGSDGNGTTSGSDNSSGGAAYWLLGICCFTLLRKKLRISAMVR